MRILQSNHILPNANSMVLLEIRTEDEVDETHFIKRTSFTKSTPPLTLSARKTFPVVAIATICECSLNGLNEMGSWYSLEAFCA